MYEKQQRKLKKKNIRHFYVEADRCTYIIHVKVRENRYLSRDFFTIILDASKLAQLMYCSLRYLHFRMLHGTYIFRNKTFHSIQFCVFF